MSTPDHGDAPVLVKGDGPIRRILLNRPERHNAQTPQMWAGLAAAGRELSADPDVRCAILTGSVRIVADDARFALAGVRHGLLPDLGATAFLPRLIGRERALDLMLTGREFSGTEAVSLGLALHALPSSSVLGTAQDYADAVARLPRAVPSYLKAAVDAADVDRSLLVAAAGQAAAIRAHPAPGGAGADGRGDRDSAG